MNMYIHTHIYTHIQIDQNSPVHLNHPHELSPARNVRPVLEEETRKPIEIFRSRSSPLEKTR